MSGKFEEIVNKQNDLIEENAIGKAISRVGQSQAFNALWYGNQQGPAESKFAYGMRLFARGDNRALEPYKKFNFNAIPVLLGWRAKYGDGLQTKINAELSKYGLEKVTDATVVPTLARFNSINYLVDDNSKIGLPENQTAFIEECLTNINKSNISSGTQSMAIPNTGRFWAGAVNEIGVLYQFNQDLNGKNKKIISDDVLELPLNTGDNDILNRDIDNYNNFVKKFVDQLINGVFNTTTRVKAPALANFLGYVQTTFFDDSTGEVLPDPDAGRPPVTDTTGTVPLIQDTSIYKLINDEFAKSISPTDNIYKNIIERILTVVTSGKELIRVVQLLKLPNPESKCSVLGIPAYPTNRFDRNVLTQQYYRAIPDTLQKIGLPGMEDTLYFVPDAEIETVRKFMSNRLMRRGEAWLTDKTSSLIRNAVGNIGNAIGNVIAHPIQTLNKGAYSFNSMVDKTISS